LNSNDLKYNLNSNHLEYNLNRWAHPITAKKPYQDFRSCNFSRLSDSIQPEKKLIELRDDDTINNNKNKNY
jgi:hypothetical protein